ncbi:MAG: hypothetical protein OEY88_07195 [Candidatus Bathyarchaeota archaeon]|nr:hypothetical protein [Candidatus Bathyarchaeota archaeon]
MTFTIVLLMLSLQSLFLISAAVAHAPVVPDNNESLAVATMISDPTKSWAIYAELHEGGEAQYYGFNMTVTEKIYVMLFKPTSPDHENFLPSFILMGPALVNQGQIPEFVETPPEAGVLVVEGKQPAQATYEPFSPGTFYSLAEVAVDAPETGTYYVAVYEEFRGGRYGLAIGYRESYAIDEWILIPLNLISVYQWEGQGLAVIFAPMVATLAVGLILMFRQQRFPSTGFVISTWIGGIAGLLFLGSGVNILFQMAIKLTQAHLSAEIAVTIVLALIPIILSIAVLRIVLRNGEKGSVRRGVYFVVLGIVALFAWAGLLVGPILAILTGIWQKFG